MSARTVLSPLAAAAAVACLGSLAVGGAAAPADRGHAAAKKITGAGVDGVKLGKTHQKLRQQGLVGRIRKGCELGGPDTRSARLRAPLKGQVSRGRSTTP
jgi:hypothetical protein